MLDETDELLKAGGWFSAGLRHVGELLQKPVSTATLLAYFGFLAEETNPDEWSEFCRVGAKRFGWGPFLPDAPRMLDDLRKFRGEPSRAAFDHQLATEAGHAYQRVLDAGDYTAAAGTFWTFRSVAEKCGRAAAEAFMAAGGPNAFATTWDESRRRKTFVDAYQHAAREEPSARLLPAGPEPKQLPAGAERDPRLTRSEAVSVLQKLREHGVPAEDVPKPRRADPFAVNVTDKRLAELKRQAEEIKAS